MEPILALPVALAFGIAGMLAYVHHERLASVWRSWWHRGESMDLDAARRWLRAERTRAMAEWDREFRRLAGEPEPMKPGSFHPFDGMMHETIALAQRAGRWSVPPPIPHQPPERSAVYYEPEKDELTVTTMSGEVVIHDPYEEAHWVWIDELGRRHKFQTSEAAHAAYQHHITRRTPHV